MAWPRFSIRGLIVLAAVLGFDALALVRAARLGRLAHSEGEYLAGFGLVLLILNGAALGLFIALSRKGVGPKGGGRLAMTPSPLVILGFYAAVLSLAILSVLFFTRGLL